MNYMNIVLIRIYRTAGNLSSSYANETKFLIYIRATKDYHITTVATETNIY